MATKGENEIRQNKARKTALAVYKKENRLYGLAGYNLDSIMYSQH